jgi:hypothetical protein
MAKLLGGKAAQERATVAAFAAAVPDGKPREKAAGCGRIFGFLYNLNM